MTNSELVMAIVPNLFLVRMHDEKCKNNSKNVFYNVKIEAKSDFCLLLVFLLRMRNIKCNNSMKTVFYNLKIVFVMLCEAFWNYVFSFNRDQPYNPCEIGLKLICKINTLLRQFPFCLSWWMNFRHQLTSYCALKFNRNNGIYMLFYAWCCKHKYERNMSIFIHSPHIADHTSDTRRQKMIRLCLLLK